MESQIQPWILWQWVPEHPLLPHVGNSTGVCSTTHMGNVLLALHWACLILLQIAGMCARSTIHKTHSEFYRNMVMVGDKHKQRINLHNCLAIGFCLTVYIATVPPDPKHPCYLFNHDKIFWGQECYYLSSSAEDGKNMDQTRRCPQVGRAEVRHYIQFKHVQNPSRLMHLRVCRKPHYC